MITNVEFDIPKGKLLCKSRLANCRSFPILVLINKLLTDMHEYFDSVDLNCREQILTRKNCTKSWKVGFVQYLNQSFFYMSLHNLFLARIMKILFD